jgi:hypothetical protein
MPQGQMTDIDIQSAIKAAIDSAESYMDSEIQPEREKAQKYFDGKVNLEHEEGRSSVVSTKVRDVVRGAKPSLMRIFLSNDKFVEYVPSSPEQVAAAEQATTYAHWVFQQCGGYNVLNDAIHDALVKKSGIVKVWWNVEEDADIHTYENLTDQEMTFIAQADDVEIIEHAQEVVIEADEFGMEVEQNRHSMKVAHKREEGSMVVENVPPEEFFINSSAKSLDDFTICGHTTEKVVGDMVALGYDYDTLVKHAGTDGNTDDEEKYLRHGEYLDDTDNTNDTSMMPIVVTEAYMRIDVDGTGVPVLHKFVCVGTNHEVLEMEPWDVVPFADFQVDPEPHAFFGRSLAELIMNDQDTATSVLRGILDNVALVNNPRKVVNDEHVEMEDVLNNEIGAVIRSTDINQIRDEVTPFVAGQTLTALQYLDTLVEEKTGITKASMGLDADALQNTTATAAALTDQRGVGQIEVMARNLAETGFKRVFKLVLHVLKTNSPEETLMRLNGQFVPVNPAVWDEGMDVSVNVGLGTGKEESKVAALMQTFQIQKDIYQGYGPTNGIVSLTQMRNTLADMLAISGIRNADRYYAPMDQQKEQQLMQQAQQMAAQQGQQPDPMVQAMVEAENIKAQAKLQSDQMKTQAKMQGDNIKLQAEMQVKAAEMQQKQGKELADLQLKYRDLQASNDLERDQMAQDLLVQAAKILGEYGTAVDVERVKAIQSAPRDINGNAQL